MIWVPLEELFWTKCEVSILVCLFLIKAYEKTELTVSDLHVHNNLSGNVILTKSVKKSIVLFSIGNIGLFCNQSNTCIAGNFQLEIPVLVEV